MLHWQHARLDYSLFGIVQADPTLAHLAPGGTAYVLGNLLFVICHYVLPPVCLLLGFLVQRVLAAESAVLLELESVGVVLLVLHGVVVSLLAVAAC